MKTPVHSQKVEGTHLPPCQVANCCPFVRAYSGIAQTAKE